MTAPTFTTRSEADPRRQMIETMAEGFFEAEKPPGSSLPTWPNLEPTYQDAVRRGISGALTAAERKGWRIDR